MRIHGNPKTTLRIATDISEPRICPFLILAVFGFPLNTPLPTGRTLTRRSRSRKVKSPKSAVIRGLRYCISPKRGWARWSRKFVRVKLVYSFLLTTDSWQPKNYASNQSARVCIANCARFFILAIFGFPRGTPLRHDKRSLTARGPARGSSRRARSSATSLFSRA